MPRIIIDAGTNGEIPILRNGEHLGTLPTGIETEATDDQLAVLADSRITYRMAGGASPAAPAPGAEDASGERPSAPGPLPRRLAGLLDKPIAEIAKLLPRVKSAAHVDAIEAAERAGKTRKGVLALIAAHPSRAGRTAGSPKE